MPATRKSTGGSLEVQEFRVPGASPTGARKSAKKPSSPLAENKTPGKGAVAKPAGKKTPTKAKGAGKENAQPAQAEKTKATKNAETPQSLLATADPVSSPPAGKVPAAINTLKRPLTTTEIEEAIELPEESELHTYDLDCNQVRRKIRALIDSGEVKVTHWLRELGINSNSYRNFMALKGPTTGFNNQTYELGYIYFKKREALHLPAPSKKRKSADGKTAALPAPAVPAVTDIRLAGEEQDDVAVYDSCDEIRRKIAAHLRKDGVTTAAFLRELAGMYHCQERKFQSAQLTKFRALKGADSGNMNGIFYSAYVYFEKIRLKEGKPKSKHRETMEAEWPGGFEIRSPGTGRRG